MRQTYPWVRGKDGAVCAGFRLGRLGCQLVSAAQLDKLLCGDRVGLSEGYLMMTL